MNKRLNTMPKSIRYFLFLLALVPFVSAADTYFVESGELTKVSHGYVIAGDLEYKLLSTVKVILRAGDEGTINELKKGDRIELRILNLDNKYRVETIRQLPDRDFSEE